MSKKNTPKKKLNSNLHKAKKVKNDEFYTLISDIEKEIKHYKEHFKGKTIFCNCDDPEWSNFWKYFSLNFKHLGLKKLISTHYKKETPFSYKLEMTMDENGETRIVKNFLKENGDFRSEEAVEILKEADIVVTNPPFSLFREYIQQLIEHKKQFLIIGSANAITYKEVFKLIKENKVWLGITHPKEFKQPDGTTKKFGNIGWFTNLTHKKRNEKIFLFKKYKGNEREYPKYDNYNAIEVSKVVDIPEDFKGAMGVPITFLEKYNPEQFEIVSSNDYRLDKNKTPFKEHGLIKDKDGTINGRPTYVRIVIKIKKEKKKKTGGKK